MFNWNSSAIILFFTLILMGCEADIRKELSSPKATLNAVFEAVRKENYAKLVNYCDPLKENDEDTRLICESAEIDSLRKSLFAYFSKAKVEGEARIQEGTAKLDFWYGPDGKDRETMKLVEREGSWYLMSF